MQRSRPWCAMLTLVVAGACASGGTGGSGSSLGVLTTDDLVGTGATNVLDAVRQLRPQWLRARGATRVNRVLTVKVYVDDRRAGEIEFLATLQPHAVAEIRLVSASDATTRWGTGNEGGVIAVTLVRS